MGWAEFIERVNHYAWSPGFHPQHFKKETWLQKLGLTRGHRLTVRTGACLGVSAFCSKI